MKAPIIAVALLSLATPRLAAAEAPHLQLEKLDAVVVELAAQKLVNSGHEKSLRTKLAHAADGLETGDRGATTQRLDTFIQEVRALQKAKVLPEKEALQLTSLAGGIGAQIDEITTTPISIDPLRLQLCEQKPCKGKERAFVNATASSPKPDGSGENPFRTIAEAIDNARFLGLCSIEIVIAPAVYHETVIVDRDLVLRASAPGVVLEGSILNHGGHRLEIAGLTLRDSPSPGAIVIGFSCSSTIIREVRIERATGYGIRQTGGAIEIFGTQVRDTRGQADESTSGAGIRLTGGILAALRLVEIDRNSGGGLLIEGLSTRVYAGGLLVRGNHINPAFREVLVETLMAGGGIIQGVAGVEVRQALLLLEWFGIEENEMVGLLAMDQARVAARYGLSRGNVSLTTPGGSSFGGFGIYALDEDARRGADVPADERPVIDLSFLSSIHNDFIGFGLGEAFGKSRRTRVEHHEIGLSLAFRNGDHSELPSYGLVGSCVDLRGIRHNRRDITFDISLPLPLPCAFDCPEGPPCREVPFVCEWCR